MALITVMSAKGAPGTTTTAMLLANLWPADSVVVDADPNGGDMALRLMGEQGQPLDPDLGLMSMLPAARRGMLPDQVLQHAQLALGGQPVVAGMPGPEQSLAVAPLWPALADAFTRVPGSDVIADVGQLNSRSTHVSLLEVAAGLVLVCRPTAWSAVHTRRRLDNLDEALKERGAVVGVVCVADPKEAAGAAVAVDRIRAGREWVLDLGTIAFDPKTVAMFEGGTVYRPERSLLVRSGRAVTGRLHEALWQSVFAGQLAAPSASSASAPAPEQAKATDTADTAVPAVTAEPGGRRSRRRVRGGERRKAPVETDGAAFPADPHQPPPEVPVGLPREEGRSR